MKMLCMALAMTCASFLGSVVALDECSQEGAAEIASVSDDFIAMDSGESRAWLYAATEDEIKLLFARAVKEGWTEDQFAAACAQLIEQQRILGVPEKKYEFAQQVLVFGTLGVAAIMAVVGLVYLLRKGTSENANNSDTTRDIATKNPDGLERELARLRVSIDQQSERTRASINRLGRHVGFNELHAAPSVVSTASSEHAPRHRR